jgi:hypothetical protein
MVGNEFAALFLSAVIRDEKTTTIKVPGYAKKCSAWFGNKKIFYASCE